MTFYSMIDLRREKSKFCARQRRIIESDVFNELQKVIPLFGDVLQSSHLDRIALLRIAIANLKLRHFMNGQNIAGGNELLGNDLDVSSCLDGFIVVVDGLRDILFVSSNVAVIMGWAQCDLIGRPLEEYVYGKDFAQLNSLLDTGFLTKREDDADDADFNLDDQTKLITLKFKSALSRRGKNVAVKSAIYKPLVASIKVLRMTKTNEPGTVVFYMRPIMSNPVLCAELTDNCTGYFTTRHSADFKTTFCHANISFYLGHSIQAIVGHSFFDLVHPQDLPICVNALKIAYCVGQSQSDLYRLLHKCGKSVWVQTDFSCLEKGSGHIRLLHISCLHAVINVLPIITSPCAPKPAIHIEHLEKRNTPTAKHKSMFRTDSVITKNLVLQADSTSYEPHMAGTNHDRHSSLPWPYFKGTNGIKSDHFATWLTHLSVNLPFPHPLTPPLIHTVPNTAQLHHPLAQLTRKSFNGIDDLSQLHSVKETGVPSTRVPVDQSLLSRMGLSTTTSMSVTLSTSSLQSFKLPVVKAEPTELMLEQDNQKRFRLCSDSEDFPSLERTSSSPRNPDLRIDLSLYADAKEEDDDVDIE